MTPIFAAPEMGMIEGGWNFVWAAYGITWLFFAFYTATLFMRSTEPPKEDR